MCQLLCTSLYIGSLSTVGEDLELCTGVYDKMNFKEIVKTPTTGKIKESPSKAVDDES